MVFRHVLAIAVLASASGLLPTLAAAHGGSARILVEPPRVNPGGTVVVEGDDLSADDLISLVISNDGRRVEIGTVSSDGQGHLTQAFVVPADLASGSYELEAVGSAGDVVAAPLVVSGEPTPSEAAEPGRDDDDPLLVPLPSGWHNSLSSPGPGTPNPAQPQATDGLPIGAVAGIVAALLLVGIAAVNVIAKRRPPA